MTTRPRLLLVPEVTELEWVIRPQLEEWAAVASFDVPGVAGEVTPEELTGALIVKRGVDELDRRGWDRCFLVGDGHGSVIAARIADERRESVEGLVLGHAKLSYEREGERAPINKEVFEAFGQLVHQDYAGFVRYGLTQVTHGSIGEELAKRMLERVPMDVGIRAWEVVAQDTESIEGLLRELELPMLFAEHGECLVSTKQGFEDAVAAFPEARTVTVAESPTVSAEFGEALRRFCDEVAAARH